MCVSVREQAGQQHFVWAGADARRHIGRVECGLLDFGVEVLWIAIQH